MQDKIEVFLDNSVFNLLFDISKSGGDLNDHHPSTEFDLWITLEVRIEIDKIPASKAEKKAFIIALLAERRIRTDFPLGFADPNRPGDSLRLRLHEGQQAGCGGPWRPFEREASNPCCSQPGGLYGQFRDFTA